MRWILIGLLGVLSSGCALIPDPPSTLGERFSGSSYVPVDPLPVYVQPDYRSCPTEPYQFRNLLESLPDNAVRIAITQVTDSGKFELGSSGVGTRGNRYEVILDYINVDTVNLRYRIRPVSSDGRVLSLFEQFPEDARFYVERLNAPAPYGEPAEEGTINVPVNVGVGLRLTASITVRSGEINLASLGAISAAAETNQVSGSLVVQTLGITGPQVTTALPMPSELNATTVQNAILSMGAIKAMLYSNDAALTTPRVTGFRNSLGQNQPRLVNAIISELARDAIVWQRPCVTAASTPTAPQTPGASTPAASE